MDIDRWMEQLTEALRARFKSRLLFVGLQGSYQRGEAHAGSDIDAVVILDRLSMEDLIAYRAVLSAMPEREKACGFISGQRELLHWPRHELFQFRQDTRSCYGDLGALLPEITRQDILDSVRVGASGLFHMCCHTAVHDPANTDILQGLYKGAFFLLQSVYYLRHTVYIRTKKDLLPLLAGDEREILQIGMHGGAVSADPDACFRLLFRWLQAILDTPDMLAQRQSV